MERPTAAAAAAAAAAAHCTLHTAAAAAHCTLQQQHAAGWGAPPLTLTVGPTQVSWTEFVLEKVLLFPAWRGWGFIPVVRAAHLGNGSARVQFNHLSDLSVLEHTRCPDSESCD